MAQDSTPTLPALQDPGTNTAESTNANFLNRKLSEVITALGDGSAASNAILDEIASAITTSLLGGVVGTTANRLLRSKTVSSGSSAGSIQNSLVNCDNSGNVDNVTTLGVGVSPIFSLFGLTPRIEAAGTDINAAAAVLRFSNDASGPRYLLGKSRGASVGTNTIVQSGDTIGRLVFVGANGTGYDAGAEILAIIDGTPGASADMPGRLEFYTTPDGSATPVLRFTTKANGNTEFSYQAGFVRTSLTDASTISWDVSTNQSAYVLLTSGVGATRVLGAPTNQRDGFTYILRVQQSSTGSNALTYNGVFKWPGGTAPTLSTANNAIDILTFVSDGTNMYGVAQKGFA